MLACDTKPTRFAHIIIRTRRMRGGLFCRALILRLFAPGRVYALSVVSGGWPAR